MAAHPSHSDQISFPAGLGWVAFFVAVTYGASLVFHWSAGWQVLILTLADLLAFVMFIAFTLRRED